MLTSQRQRIDQIDRDIVHLFEERTAVVEEVAAIKRKNGIDILDASREEQIIQKVKSYLERPELGDELAALYTEIMRISRSHQEQWMKNQD